jgi:hypothetical protein
MAGVVKNYIDTNGRVCNSCHRHIHLEEKRRVE